MKRQRTDRVVVLWCADLDESTRRRLEEAGVDCHQRDPVSGRALVAEGEIEAIVGTWTDAWRAVLARLERKTTFIHVGEALPQGLVDFVAAGGSGWSAESPEEACGRLTRLFAPRRDLDRLHLSDEVWVHFEAHPAARLLDCSSAGFSLRVPASAALARFAEGARLSQVRFEHQGETILRHEAARVRSLVPVGDGFRVGCEFEVSDESGHLPADRRGEDPLRTLALFARLVKVSPIVMKTEAGAVAMLEGGALDAQSRRLAFEGGQAVRPYEVLECAAHLDDARFEWRSSVVSADPLVLHLPRRVTESVRRRPVRRAPLRAGLARFVAPLSRTKVEARVLDFTPKGARLELAARDGAFPPGLRLDALWLDIDGVALTVRAEIRHHTATSVGVHFTSSAAELQELNRAWVIAGSPRVSDGQALTFDEVWEFCRKAGLVTDEVATVFESLKPAARDSQARLARDGGQLFAALAYRDHDELQGYLSAFRAYRHTWYVQHMAATATGTRAAFDLNRAIGELCERSEDAQYFQLAYYVDNPWPARVFGGFSRRVETGGAVLKVRSYQRVRNDSPWSRQPSPSCRLATAADIPQVVSLLGRNEVGLLLNAMDLEAEHLTLATLDSQYARLGLGRHRQVLVCEQHGRLVAVALCEVAPVGINFRELGSSVRLYFDSDLSQTQREDASAELGPLACRLYEGLGRPFTLLCDALPVPEEARWGSTFQLAELTARTELLRDFKRLVRLSSAMVARRRSRGRAAQAVLATVE